MRGVVSCRFSASPYSLFLCMEGMEALHPVDCHCAMIFYRIEGIRSTFDLVRREHSLTGTADSVGQGTQINGVQHAGVRWAGDRINNYY